EAVGTLRADTRVRIRASLKGPGVEADGANQRAVGIQFEPFMVQRRMRVQDWAGVGGIAVHRNPLRNLSLEIGDGAKSQAEQERRLEREMSGSQAIRRVSRRRVDKELAADLQQFAIEDHRFAAEFHVADARLIR